MKKEIISTTNAPAAVGPYSQAVKIGDFLYTSGQIALDPATGVLAPAEIEVQSEQVMKNLSAVLEAAGYTFDEVIKTGKSAMNLIKELDLVGDVNKKDIVEYLEVQM